METPYLDKEIDRLRWLQKDGSLSDYGKKHLDEFETIKEALSIHSVSKPLPKGVKIKSAETPQGFEFDQIDYDNWLESDIDDLDDFLEQELC